MGYGRSDDSPALSRHLEFLRADNNPRCQFAGPGGGLRSLAIGAHNPT